ncbi:MAG: tetratricopeptide repeat protein [Myxococcales bacterium]|jgi:tetratricopeptide (TPR) repeat protein|nr:tetratricopeptide repeat protein [Myxococcales bacterium]
MKSNVFSVVMLCVLCGSAREQTPPPIDCDANAACVALVDQAQQQSKAGQVAEAEKSYKLAYEVSHDARLLFNIARVLDKRGQGPEAMSYYRQFIQAPVEDEAQKAKAREYVAQLEAKLAVPPAPTAPSASPMSDLKTAPVYKKGWFWAVMVGSIAAVGVGVGLGVGLSNRSPTIPRG